MIQGAPSPLVAPLPAVAPAEPWLLLVHQLPARPVGLRVKTWRRLQQLGAVAVKNSVYALPNRPEMREDFEWVRAEIVGAGGQATVFQATTIDSLSSDELREAFRRDRQQDYRAVVDSAETLLPRPGAKRRRPAPRSLDRALRQLRARVAQIEAIDYFAAPGREDAQSALDRVHASQAKPGEAQAASGVTLDLAEFQGRHWVTRPRPGIDRLASAWLVRRFVDCAATFGFAEPGLSHRSRTITFDMFEGDFTHDGDRCTFEGLCTRFGLRDPRLPALAELVHDLDVKDGRYGRADAPLLGALVEGLRLVHDDDQNLLVHGIALFEALYQGLALLRTTPAAAKTSRPRTRRRARGA